MAEQALVAVNLSAPQDVLDVPGIKLGSAATGLKASDDIVVAHLDPQARVAGVYTQSSFAAAPVLLARDRQENCQAWVINSGNANAATGEPGKQDARIICAAVAELLRIDSQQVHPFSTGVIGERLDMPALTRAVAEATEKLRSDGWLSAASAIMTTDTVG